MKTTQREPNNIILNRANLIKQLFIPQKIEKFQAQRLSPAKDASNTRLRNNNYNIKLDPLRHVSTGKNPLPNLVMKTEGDKKSSKFTEKSIITDKSKRKYHILDTSIDSISSEKSINISNRLIFSIPQKKLLPQINHSLNKPIHVQHQILLNNLNDHSNLIKSTDKGRNKSSIYTNQIRERRDRDISPPAFFDRNKENSNSSNLTMNMNMNLNSPHDNTVVTLQTRNRKIIIPRILLSNIDKSLTKTENSIPTSKSPKILSRKQSESSLLLLLNTKNTSKIPNESNSKLLTSYSTLSKSITFYFYLIPSNVLIIT